jgi:hypothetical protein
MKTVQRVGMLLFFITATHPSRVTVIESSAFPVEGLKSTAPGPVLELYLTESAKNASSAMISWRRSDFMTATNLALSAGGTALLES